MSLDLTGQPFPVTDDRIFESDCADLKRNGECKAAADRRRLDVHSRYAPGDISLPRRCEFFVAKPGAADQRSGRERYPMLWAEYEATQGERARVGLAQVKRAAAK